MSAEMSKIAQGLCVALDNNIKAPDNNSKAL